MCGDKGQCNFNWLRVDVWCNASMYDEWALDAYILKSNCHTYLWKGFVKTFVFFSYTYQFSDIESLGVHTQGQSFPLV
eukprot:c31233_g1_i1 orf=55-288(-)